MNETAVNTAKVKEQIQGKYDREVDKYDSIFLNRAGQHFIRKKMFAAQSFNYIKPGQDVLEVGSATGVFSFVYEKLGINLTAVDLSPENIKWASEKGKKLNSSITFKQADVESLPFKDNTFDGVLSFSTLRYVPNIDLALKEIYRVVKPGGYIILDFPNKKCPWFGGMKKKIIGREHIFDNHYYVEEVKDMVARAGFKDIETRRGLFVPKGTPDNWVPAFRVSEFLAERLPVVKDYSAIIFIGGRK